VLSIEVERWEMPVKVLVCDPVDKEGLEKLRQEGFEVDVKPSITSEELERTVSGYDVLVVRSRTRVTRRMVELGKKLRVIGRAGTGLDNIDLEAANSFGVTVLNTAEALADSVAELTIGLMFALTRRIAFADTAIKDGNWLKRELEGSLLKGKTLGLIGLGNIGVRVAKLAKAIGMRILVTKRTPPSPETLEALEAQFVPLQDLLRRSDIVSVHVPLTPQTRRMISRKEIGLMKEGAFLVNTSRGGIVDEDALLDALKSNRLGGAGLDVYESEPPRNLELVKLTNMVCTPHIGAQTKEAQKAASILLAEKIIQFFRDQPA